MKQLVATIMVVFIVVLARAQSADDAFDLTTTIYDGSAEVATFS